MRNDSRPNSLDSVFTAFLFISQIYYGYRYIFQYNSEGTSPTYRDTPVIFQASKYVITAAVFGWSFMLLVAGRNRTVHVSKSRSMFFVLILGYLAYCMVIDLTLIDEGSSWFGDTMFIRAFFFFPLLSLLPYHYQGRSSLARYAKAVVGFGVAYHVIYSAIQVVLYWAVGRLPALGYAGGFVRFGGGWDDPNGFGTFLVLPLIVLINGRFVPGITRYAMTAALLFLLALTSSITGFVGFLSAMFVFAIIKRRFIVVGGTSLAVMAILIASPDVRSLISFIYQAKSGSIQSHFEQLSLLELFENSSLVELLLGQHVVGGARNESFYIALFENYGLVGLLWLSVIVGLTLLNANLKMKLARDRGDADMADIYAILAAFIVGFCAASAVTPSFYVFPVNLYAWLAILLVWLTPVVDPDSDASCEVLSVP